MKHVIQNPDINVGPASYKNLMSDELLVSKVFYTIQGEGPFAGYPAVFIRLAGCNRGRKTDMGCTFCDTAFQFAQGEPRSFAGLQLEMMDLLRERVTSSRRDVVVVITGGEPMMQNNLAAFCKYLSQYGWSHIQIESNGDRLVPGLSGNVVLVVSPKVSKAREGGYEYKELNPQVFDRANYFKFLVEANTNSPYHQPPSWAFICGRPVYVSPMTQYRRPATPGEMASGWDNELVDVPATRANYQHAAALARRYGYRVSMQQHLFFEVP